MKPEERISQLEEEIYRLESVNRQLSKDIMLQIEEREQTTELLFTQAKLINKLQKQIVKPGRQSLLDRFLSWLFD